MNVTLTLTERPLHGKLSDYTTLSDYLTYTPNDGEMLSIYPQL